MTLPKTIFPTFGALPPVTVAAVCYPQVSWFAGLGGARPQHRPTPAQAVAPASWARLVDMAGRRWFTRGGEGVLCVRSADDATDTQRRKLAAQLVEQLGALGWKTTDAGGATGWFTCHHPDPAAALVMFGVLPWVDQGRTPLFRLDDPAVAVAEALAGYQGLVGSIWRGTGGLSGTAAIRALHDGKRAGGAPRWRWDNPPSDVVGRSFELIGGKHGRPCDWWDGGPDWWVHQYDVRAMYLAAASVAELAWDPPEHTGPRQYDPERVGYWQVNRDELETRLNHSPGRLSLLLRAQTAGSLAWVTTPVLEYLTGHMGGSPEIHDSWTAERRSRLLRGWAERLRDARQGAGPQWLPAVKDTYARTVGMMRKPGGRIYRPDWRDLIVDTAKVNLLRKVDAGGVEPLRWNVDSVWIPTDSPNGRDSLYPDTGRIGALRYENTMTIDEYRAKYEASE